MGATWDAPGGGKRSYSIGWDESEILECIRKNSCTRGKAVQVLSAQAEMLVVTYIHSQDSIGDGTYAARMKELRRVTET